MKLEMQNIIVDSLDSIIKHFDDPLDCLNTREQCCIRSESTNEIEPFSDLADFKCEILYGVDEKCRYLPPQNGLFRFNFNEKTLLSKPNSLIIKVNSNIYHKSIIIELRIL
jgi:hypothetical protein